MIVIIIIMSKIHMSYSFSGLLMAAIKHCKLPLLDMQEECKNTFIPQLFKSVKLEMPAFDWKMSEKHGKLYKHSYVKFFSNMLRHKTNPGRYNSHQFIVQQNYLLKV